MFRDNKMLFYKTRQCSIPVFICTIFAVLFTIAEGGLQYLASGVKMDAVSVINNILSNVIFGVVIFMYLACEYMSQGKKHNVEECIQASGNNKIKAVQFFICLYYNGVITILLLSVCCVFCIACHIFSVALFSYLITIFFFYFFLIITGAIFIGWGFSYISNELIKYVSMVLLAFYFMIRANQLLNSKEVLGGISDFTQFFCVSAHWQSNFGYLLSVEWHFLIKPVVFVFFAALFVYIQRALREGRKKYVLCAGITIIFIAASVLVWKQPVSGCYFGYDYGTDTDSAHNMTDNETSVQSFYVDSYDISLKIENGLAATVTVTPSNSALKYFEFTLYKGYHISNIYSENMEPLIYEVKDNLVTVNNTDNGLSQIIFQYEGTGTNDFYSGKQGIFLAGNFPYYPIAGAHNLYNPALLQLSEQESRFDVHIDYKGKIFSNLTQIEQGQYAGCSNHLTLISGFWNETVLDGITYIYPLGASYMNPEYNDMLHQAVMEYQDKEVENQKITYRLREKKILIYPYDMSMGCCMFGSDMVMISGSNDLLETYEHFLRTGYWYLEETQGN